MHGSEGSESSVPGVEITVWEGRITVTFSRGSDSVTFYVTSAEGETVEETLGRALLTLSQPQVTVRSVAVN
jgi:hypothetical protein